jgi:hypothetical protein
MRSLHITVGVGVGSIVDWQTTVFFASLQSPSGNNGFKVSIPTSHQLNSFYFQA